MPDEPLILGWDIGGTTCSAVVATADGEILDRREWPSRVEAGPDAMRAEFLDRAAALRESHAVGGVGVSVGGPMDSLRGVVHSPPHLPGWDEVPLADLLGGALKLPVVVEHDAAACLLAERLWGAAAGATHCAYLTCGTGCGAGLMIDGRVVRGPDGRTPELGHVRLAADGPVVFGKAGCVESFCSGAGIAELAAWMFPYRFDGPADPAELVRLADEGSLASQQVLAEAARRLGQACAILADLFAPQVIVLGALARHFGDDWVRQVRESFADEALPINAAGARIVPAALGERLGDLSPIAACLHRTEQIA